MDGNNEILKLKLTPYNKHLIEARKDAGYTLKVMSLLTGVMPDRLGKIERLVVAARVEEKEELASALCKPVEYLFPDELEEIINTGLLEVRERSITRAQVRAISAERANEEIEKVEKTLFLKEAVLDVLVSLTPLEQKVLTMRFGFDDGISRTLADVGEEIGRSRERARQIEAKALRKLRHPRRSRDLKGYL